MSIDRKYVSEMDSFLHRLDEHPSSHSDSRRLEEKKYRKINELRDKPQVESKDKKLWKDF